MRILVVEDEQALNELLVKQLQAAHYSVDGCLTGSDALDYLLGAEYDAVVLDIMLPGVSGLEVLRRMRAKGDRTPVILLTAKDGIEDRVTGLDAGADDYLVKPFAFDELLARHHTKPRQRQRRVHCGRPHGGLRGPHRKPRRRAGGAFVQGICHFGIPGAQPRHCAFARENQPPCVEL